MLNPLYVLYFRILRDILKSNFTSFKSHCSQRKSEFIFLDLQLSFIIRSAENSFTLPGSIFRSLHNIQYLAWRFANFMWMSSTLMIKGNITKYGLMMRDTRRKSTIVNCLPTPLATFSLFVCSFCHSASASFYSTHRI